ncbi:hypothetical protein [Thermoleptolyngbya sp.]
MAGDRGLSGVAFYWQSLSNLQSAFMEVKAATVYPVFENFANLIAKITEKTPILPVRLHVFWGNMEV